MDQIIYAIITWNVMTFLLYGWDKRKAIKRRLRISERALILAAFLMGGAGALLGMNVFRHKTKHLKFRILIPCAVVCNVLVVLGLGYLEML